MCSFWLQRTQNQLFNAVGFELHRIFDEWLRMRTERGEIYKIGESEWFAGPVTALENYKKAVKSSISRPFLVDLMGFEPTTVEGS